MLSLAPCLFALCSAAQTQPAPQATGESQFWQAHLNVAKPDESQVADLEFGLELLEQDGSWSAYLVNEPERIPIPKVSWDGTQLSLAIEHYDSRIEAELNAEGLLEGSWRKLRGKDNVAEVPFWATRGKPEPKPTRAVLPLDVAGRWAVQFADDEHASVGIFQQAGERLTGTFLNATGDFRYLAGRVEGRQLKLSCFDGAHAFLFEAEIGEDGSLEGSFRSGNWWLDSWSAKRDAVVQMTDSFQQTSWDHEYSLAELNFLDEAGQLRSLIEPGFMGQATILQLFGTWCPNCHDETRYLVELQRRYADRGLRVVGLAFELSGEFQRDVKQIDVFRKRHDVPYPMLLAGTADKRAASLAFPAIDRLRSFPTSIFIDSTGRVRGLHSGFAGPATGDEHTRLRAHYEGWIESLLSEEPAPTAALQARLAGSIWQEPGGPLRVQFALDEAGALQASHTPMDSIGQPQLGEAAPASVTSEVSLRADTLWFAGLPWRLDERVGTLAPTLDYGRRLFELGAPAKPIVRQLAGVSTEDLVSLVTKPDETNSDLVTRVEALFLIAHGKLASDAQSTRLVELLQDPSHRIRMGALHTLGELRYRAAIPALRAHLEHPNAAERREAVDALVALGLVQAELKSECPELWAQIDVLVRKTLSDQED